MANFLILALRNPLRQRMLKFIIANPKTPVNAIVAKINDDQSIISQHLGILREAGIVTTLRKGRSIHYSINQRRLSYLIGRIQEITKSH